MRLFLIVLLLASQPLFASDIATAPSDAPKIPFQIRYSKRLRACSAALVLAALGPGIGANIYGYLNGTPHLGYRIFDDAEKVDAMLDARERELLSDTKINGEKLAASFSNRLGKNPGETSVLEVLLGRPRYASEFLDNENPNHGNCRQMATVLAGELRRRGVRADVYWGYLKRTELVGVELQGGLHAFVGLPDYGVAIDPINGHSATIEEYLADVEHPIKVTHLIRWVGFR